MPRGQECRAGRSRGGSLSRALALLLLVVSLSLTGVHCKKPLKVKIWWTAHHASVDTDGFAWGVAAQGIYAFVADGSKGLKVFNLSNPKAIKQVGALNLPGYNAQVAVDGSVAVLTDLTQAALYVVDISNPVSPQLKWTHQLADRARAVALEGGVAFVVERGVDPTAASYFAGVEAVKCSLSQAPVTLKKLAMAEVIDVDAGATHVYAATAHGVTLLARSAAGFTTPAVATFSVGAGDTLQSLDYADGYLILLGKEAYFLDVTTATAPKKLHQRVISGYAKGRVVALSGIFDQSSLPFSSGSSSVSPFKHMAFSYITEREYGFGQMNIPDGQIFYVQQGYDVYADTKGKARLYDIVIRSQFSTVIKSGGISRVGAFGNHGLVYERLEVAAPGP